MLSPRFMADHLWAQRRLSDYLDGELGTVQARRVERHVHRCPRCRQFLATLRRTVEGLSRLSPEPAPAGLADGVVERLPGPPWAP
ncbi:MAG: zf-HC2 domain-containing protein [Actinobacteria bacterium]|nr:zf-HC2 domain-containing protein [Actinomycetota bacterium]